MRYLFIKRPTALRLTLSNMLQRTWSAVRRRPTALPSLLLLILAALLFRSCFSFGLNASPSLPHRLYLIHKGADVERGQYAAFRWQGGGPYQTGATFVKILAGIPGDTVSQTNRTFFVNGKSMGSAKHTSREGVPLETGPTGSIPSGQYYVMALHPDSLDSRYRLTGWISHSQIIGRAYALF